MTWGATAIAGATLVSGAMGKKSADKSSKLSNQQYQQTRSDLSPYREAGTNALNEYTGAIGGYNQDLPQYNSAEYSPGGEFQFDLQGDQGYQFALSEAMKQIDRGQAAGGGFNSGNRRAALVDRATGMASTYANDAFNRQMGTSRENYGRGLTDYGIRDQRANNQFNIASGQEQDLYGRDQNYLNRLSNLAGSGQNAAAQTGGFGAQNVANQINANQYGAESVNNAVQGGIGNYLTYDYLQNNPIR